MDADRFDTLTRSVPAAGSRRRALVAVLAGSLAALGLRDTGAKKKKKKKKPASPTCTCPPPPPPPPATYCAGKNYCATSGDKTACNVAGTTPCYCLVRADNATTFCGAPGPPVDSCTSCTGEKEICVVLGGICERGFACAIPCPNPR